MFAPRAYDHTRHTNLLSRFVYGGGDGAAGVTVREGRGELLPPDVASPFRRRAHARDGAQRDDPDRVLGGVVALLAPCCVSVMLPAYFSATFARRSRILAMTLVFAIGVGTVILPIGLGASAISRLLAGQHFAVFAVMGVLLAAGGAAMIAGGKMMLPMPGMRGRRPGVAGV